ncbi:MAG: hypothetical protein K0Q49_75 [Haloplasmataceae bacterium]|jgi:hypothetical protein|nr:hypothetical protein [Haloplasmataceae bacterium]
MNRKYITRILVWALLVIILSVGSFYLRLLLIQPLNTQIENLSKKKIDTEQTIKLLETQLNNFNNITYNNNEISLMVPLNLDIDEIEQKYVLRPVYMLDLILNDYNISDGAPTNLLLSKDIGSKKITVDFTIEKDEITGLEIGPLYDYINELYASQRSVYFGNFTYKQQGELMPGKEPMSSINVTLEYYLFYYKK